MQPKTQPLSQPFTGYAPLVAEAFYERFRRLLEERGISDAEAAATTGLGVSQISRLKNGIAQDIKLDAALRLCDRYSLDPWVLEYGEGRAKHRSPINPAPPQMAPAEESLLGLRMALSGVIEALEAAGVLDPSSRAQLQSFLPPAEGGAGE